MMFRALLPWQLQRGFRLLPRQSGHCVLISIWAMTSFQSEYQLPSLFFDRLTSSAQSLQTWHRKTSYFLRATPLMSPEGLIRINSVRSHPVGPCFLVHQTPSPKHPTRLCLSPQLLRASPGSSSLDYTLQWSHWLLNYCFIIKIFLRGEAAPSEVAFAQHSRKLQSQKDRSMAEHLPERWQLLRFIFRTPGREGGSQTLRTKLTLFSITV